MTRSARLRDAGASLDDSLRLLEAVQDLSHLRDVAGVADVVRHAARELTGADGVTFVLREGDLVHYADEDAIAPLWKGRRFPIHECIAGWVMVNREPAIVEDVYADPRIPLDVYRSTFVRGLALVPIRSEEPLGAIGVYWASPHRASDRELQLLEALAASTAVALENADLYRRLEEAVRARDQFLAIAAHELRTPLTALKLQLEGIERSLGNDAPEQANSRLAAAQRSARRVEDLIEHLLGATVVSAGRLEPRRENVDLVAIIREVAGRMQERVAATGSRLELALAGEVVGSWDSGQLAMVVGNLIDNAAKFGEGRPIRVRVEDADGAARLTVEDEGIGIPPTDHSRIFGRFERAVAIENYGGFGIGLWAVKQIVEAHGGTVVVASRVERGTSFVVELPKSPVPRLVAAD